MNAQIEKLQVFYKDTLLVYGTDYTIENYEIVFKCFIEKKYVRMYWEKLL